MPKTIVITGASNGLGAALALHFAAPQINLGLIGRNTERLAEIASQCNRKGAQTYIGVIDVTNTQQMSDWLIDLDNLKPIDLIIANAGITHSIDSNGQAEPLENVRKVLDINLIGVLNTIHPLLNRMCQRQNGQIALVSSLAAYCGMPITPAYSASKAAIKSYGEALRGLLKSQSIKVNIICPGFIKSDMSDHFPGSRPFLLTADKAAKTIAEGLAKDKPIIAFPLTLHIGMWLLGLLPFSLASFFMGLSGYNQARFPKK